MTEIQAAALPQALAGADLIGQAKTGSGKTAAFALPLLAKINPRDFGSQALIFVQHGNWLPRSPVKYVAWRATSKISRSLPSAVGSPLDPRSVRWSMVLTS